MKKLVKRILLVPVTLLVLNILVIRHMAPGGGGYKSRIIGWGIRFKLQMLCPQEDV